MNQKNLTLTAIIALVVVAFFLGKYNASQPAPDNENKADTEQPVSSTATTKSLVDNATDNNIQFTHFRVGKRNVKSILSDGDVMWVGTSGGVIRYDTKADKYRMLDISSGLLANGVFHLSKLNDRLVVGTYGGGLSIKGKDNDAWTTYNIPHGLADAFVYDVLRAGNGDIWIATWSGANRVRNGNFDDLKQWDTYTVENTKGGLPNDWVYALAQGKDDTIWMATEGGLASFRNGEWKNWGHADGLGAKYEVVRDQISFNNDPAAYSKHHARQKQEMGLEKVDVAYNPNYIVALVVDREGIVWCGTWGGGLARFDGKQWKNYSVADGLPGNHVFMLHEDLKGRLWAGTNNGLALMQDGGFKTYTIRDGLYSNTVFSMATTQSGEYWVGSFGGVARLVGLD